MQPSMSECLRRGSSGRATAAAAAAAAAEKQQQQQLGEAAHVVISVDEGLCSASLAMCALGVLSPKNALVPSLSLSAVTGNHIISS
jgi:hypothetical protein